MVYECEHCNGICEIEIMRETEKATEPEIEFCPFCGLSNSYPKEEDIDEIGC